MITRYDIEFENKNTVLIVNLDFYYEFSNFNYKEYTKNLKKEIEKIAKKNGARKVKIIIGGVLLSTLFLTPNYNIENNSNTFITNNTIKKTVNKFPIYEDIIIIDVSTSKEDINNNIENDILEKENYNIINTPTNNIKKPKDNINNKLNNNLSNSFINNGLNNLVDKKENTSEKIENNIVAPKEEQKNEIINNKTYVTINRSNGNIIKLELEEYLIGVVGSEMPASFNIEALKAQAIVARTYALKRISQNKILTDTTSTQVYKDNNELKNIWKNDFNKYYENVKNAVMATKGMVLMYNNNYIDAVYHSTSNGMTEDAIYVWGYSVPYLKSVESKTDINVSSYKKEVTFTLEKLSSILNTTITKDTTFILERNSSGRVSNVKVNDLEIKGTTFRTLLNLRSTDFIIELDEENAKITTYGFGHGVGMSQYGANEMANNGYIFRNILNHYYQNIVIKNI